MKMMNQIQYQIIMKLILNGAPALADELCTAFSEVCAENEQLKEKLKELTMPTQPATENNSENSSEKVEG